MANVLVEESYLQDIADAIRAKTGSQNTYKPGQMGSAIEAIPTGSTPTGTINITANGTHDVTNYASANVDVPTGSTPTGTKQISITANGTTTEDVSAYANAEITVNVPSSGGYAFSSITVVFENSRSGTLAINRLLYPYSGSPLFGFGRTNLASGGSLTIANMATDGTHVFFNPGANVSITYNGEAAEYIKFGTDYMLTIPEGYDASIPFVLA